MKPTRRFPFSAVAVTLFTFVCVVLVGFLALFFLAGSCLTGLLNWLKKVFTWRIPKRQVHSTTSS